MSSSGLADCIIAVNLRTRHIPRHHRERACHRAITRLDGLSRRALWCCSTSHSSSRQNKVPSHFIKVLLMMIRLQSISYTEEFFYKSNISINIKKRNLYFVGHLKNCFKKIFTMKIFSEKRRCFLIYYYCKNKKFSYAFPQKRGQYENANKLNL